MLHPAAVTGSCVFPAGRQLAAFLAYGCSLRESLEGGISFSGAEPRVRPHRMRRGFALGASLRICPKNPSSLYAPSRQTNSSIVNIFSLPAICVSLAGKEEE
jgi:hypothetical protein